MLEHNNNLVHNFYIFNKVIKTWDLPAIEENAETYFQTYITIPTESFVMIFDTCILSHQPFLLNIKMVIKTLIWCQYWITTYYYASTVPV